MSPHDFACAAQQLFSLWHGRLRFHSLLPNSDLTVMHDPSMSSCNCACWTYQGKRSVCPPELQFDNLAIQYRTVECSYLDQILRSSILLKFCGNSLAGCNMVYDVGQVVTSLNCPLGPRVTVLKPHYSSHAYLSSCVVAVNDSIAKLQLLL